MFFFESLGTGSDFGTEPAPEIVELPKPSTQDLYYQLIYILIFGRLSQWNFKSYPYPTKSFRMIFNLNQKKRDLEIGHEMSDLQYVCIHVLYQKKVNGQTY